MALLDIKNLTVNYGGICAVKGVNLSVEEKTIVALLGANGAGKTTILRTVSGLVKASEGEILFGKKNIVGWQPHRVAAAGIAQSPEGRLILSGLTTEENLRVGGYRVGKKELKNNFERVYDLFPVLKERRKQQADTLSGGEQQMLAIGRALMSSPGLLLLDEPSLGLAPLIVREIFHTLLKIRSDGTTILMVEQNALQTLKIADYAFVLELGKISASGKAQDLLKDDKLVDAYLGGKKQV